MTRSIYLWSLRPESGFALELRIRAESASAARREVRRFLSEHDGAAWQVDRITREAIRVPHGVVMTPGPGERRGSVDV